MGIIRKWEIFSFGKIPITQKSTIFAPSAGIFGIFIIACLPGCVKRFICDWGEKNKNKC